MRVRVSESDTHAMRFFMWDKNRRIGPLKVFRATRNIFGGTPSPTCCNFALQKLADEKGAKYGPDVVKTIKKDFYFDDLMKSAHGPPSYGCSLS